VHNTEGFVDSLSLLGRFLGQFPDHARQDSRELARLNSKHYARFRSALDREPVLNPWFTAEWLEQAVSGIALMLHRATLNKWLSPYRLIPPVQGMEKTVGLVLAGNIPMVGFHDVLCVLAAGHRVLAKPSSRDDRLIRELAGVLSDIDPELGGKVSFTDERLRGMDAVIATGSDNSARYFEYYFRGIPHIIRKNRNGVAVITGEETEEELHALGRDIFTYFGLGCRNVTKLFVPEGYDLKLLLGVLDRFNHLARHHKYANNIDYYRSIYLLNRQEFLDNGVLLLKEDPALASPVGVVFYERYSEIESMEPKLMALADQIQCTVCVPGKIPGTIAPGTTQQPMPWDYADGIDTLRFLTEMKKDDSTAPNY
jgi:hypothetical protein